jgi:Uma2 family endonuclease
MTPARIEEEFPHMSAVAQVPIPTQPRISAEQPAVGQRLVLRDVTWLSYEAIGNALLDRPGLRMTYDRGNLEIMTTSSQHEIYKSWLGRLIETIAEEAGLPLVSAGNMTFKRDDLSRGIEGDNCYWITHEPQLRGRLTWDASRDPPPDLVLEIEISRSALNRMTILAALRIPEVWCFDGNSLRVNHLQPDGGYRLTDRSLAFPNVPLANLAPFLQPSETIDSLTVLRTFREWLRSLPPQ